MFLDELSRILRLRIPADQIIKLAGKETEKITLAEEAMELERIKLLRQRYAGTDIEQRPENLTFFSVEETIDLGIARKDAPIYDRPFKSFSVTEHLPGETAVSPHNWGAMLPKAYIRFNTLASPIYRVRYGEIRGNFNKIYLTNTAQSGYSLSYVISNSPNASYGMRGDTMAVLEAMSLLQGYTTKKTIGEIWSALQLLTHKAQNTPITLNAGMPNANEEYTLTIPVNTKSFKAVLADLSTFRLAWVAGKVAGPTAPYWTQPANIPYECSGLDFQVAKAFYFASPAATKDMQIECYT